MDKQTQPVDASADRKSDEINVTMEGPVRILMLFTIMNRGGAETMVMNYYRHIDRNRVQFDFMVHRQEQGVYDDEIKTMGGKIYRMIPLHPFTFGTYRKQISDFSINIRSIGLSMGIVRNRDISFIGKQHDEQCR